MLSQVAQTAACTRFHFVEARLARWLLMTRDSLLEPSIHRNSRLHARAFGASCVPRETGVGQPWLERPTSSVGANARGLAPTSAMLSQHARGRVLGFQAGRLSAVASCMRRRTESQEFSYARGAGRTRAAVRSTRTFASWGSSSPRGGRWADKDARSRPRVQGAFAHACVASDGPADCPISTWVRAERVHHSSRAGALRRRTGDGLSGAAVGIDPNHYGDRDQGGLTSSVAHPRA
jgi:hypothetical protein